MATRGFPAGADIVCDVETKDGRTWVGCDLFNHNNDVTAVFWINETSLMMVPVQDILSIVVYEREKE